MNTESDYSNVLLKLIRQIKDSNYDEAFVILHNYIDKQYDLLHNLLSRPTDVLTELQEFYRLENPNKDGRFYLPDATTFYKWIVKKFQYVKIKFAIKNEKGGYEITEETLLKKFCANFQGDLFYFYMTGFNSKIGLKRKDNKKWKVYFMRNNKKILLKEIETIQDFVDIFKAIDGGYPAIFNDK